MVFGLKLGLKKSQVEPPPRDDSGESRQQTKGGAIGAKGALTVNEFVARTKRSREKGLEPTKPELIAYARYLGVDPITDGDLMWIADEALNAPLPSEWTEHHDSADRVFYYNVQTHASSWTHPLEQLHRDTYKGIVNFRSGDLSKDEQLVELEKLQRKCEDAEKDAHKELQMWTEHTDEQGQKFYYNRDQQRSVWTDPRPARCHALYLQMKALRVLSSHCGQAAGRIPEDYGRGLLNRELGTGLPLGNNAKGAGKTDRPQHLSPLGDDGASGADNDDSELIDKDRSRKKKKRKEHKEKAATDDDRDAEPPQSLGRGDPLRGGMPPALGSLDKPGASPLNFKKPPMSAVEEVRQALGVAHGGGMSGGLPPLGRNPMGNMGMGGPGARLSTPPGDGLSNVGRARVRAGIKLEPIKG